MDILRQFRDCWRQEPTSTTRTRMVSVRSMLPVKKDTLM
ncbi:hypothetical protein GBAR_LOCUS31221 [Geodia barretti]|uniref:Uncharacterized protein n=1 Tax=Geodia barretti TaxID=519541 RepID=A0AA35U270_GEOBA|nr:hypothetical protein GBAR_LOCUS31221 [Geodia barretti]